MESTAGRWLPIQSPPVSRGLPARQGHRHPGGIHAAQCEGAGGFGTCHYPKFVVRGVSCNFCCSPDEDNNASYWVSNETGERIRCDTPDGGS